VPGNLEILDVKGKLDALLHALPRILNSCLHTPVAQAAAAAAVVTASLVGGVTPAAVTTEHTQLSTAVAAACRVIWKLATATDLRRRLVACGAAQSLFAVAAKLPLLMPNGTGTTAVHTDEQHNHSTTTSTKQHVTELADDDHLSSTSIHCYGALAALMPSTAVKDDVAAHTTAINSTGNNTLQSHLHTLFDAAQYSPSSTACDMAATALAAALTTHAGCRIAAAKTGLAPRLSTLMQHPRSSAVVRLCAAASAHAFVRSDVDRALLTAADCGPILVQAAALCGWAVEQLGSLLQQGHQQKAAAAAASDVDATAAADSGEALLKIRILDNESAHEDDECDESNSSNGSGSNGWKLGIAGESRTLIRILEQVRSCIFYYKFKHDITKCAL
jgi:DNA-binding FrmR family transcriptional regulator